MHGRQLPLGFGARRICVHSHTRARARARDRAHAHARAGARPRTRDVVGAARDGAAGDAHRPSPDTTRVPPATSVPSSARASKTDWTRRRSPVSTRGGAHSAIFRSCRSQGKDAVECVHVAESKAGKPSRAGMSSKDKIIWRGCTCGRCNYNLYEVGEEVGLHEVSGFLP